MNVCVCHLNIALFAFELKVLINVLINRMETRAVKKKGNVCHLNIALFAFELKVLINVLINRMETRAVKKKGNH